MVCSSLTRGTHSRSHPVHIQTACRTEVFLEDTLSIPELGVRMSTRWARFARGWLAATFATLIAAASHAAAGGIPPNVASIALALAFSGVACVLLTGRTLSLLRTSVAVVGSQLAFHLVFSSLGGAATGAAESVAPHAHAAASLAHTAQAAHHTDPAMWFAHAVAAVLTVIVLRKGEAAFWGMRDAALRFIGTILPTAPRMPVAITRATVTASPARVFPPRLFVLLIGSLQHRGPPARAFA